MKKGKTNFACNASALDKISRVYQVTNLKKLKSFGGEIENKAAL